MSVIVAAGPYTVESNLDYEPLGALLESAEMERPDVLVLVSCHLPVSNTAADTAAYSWDPLSMPTTL